MTPQATTAIANGMLPVPAAALQKTPNPPRSRAAKAAAPRLKVVIRRLAPGLTQAEFEEIIGEEWKLGGGKVDWFSYRVGKISKDPSKPSKPSRCYLRLSDQSHLSHLSDKVRQTPFVDSKNSHRDQVLVGPPCLEFAPYSRVPTNRRRHDNRQGLIDQDAEFKSFLESLTNPPVKLSQQEAASDGGASKDEKVTTTPLIEHIREKKAAKEKPSKSSKHNRGESRDTKGDKVGEKKILSKAGKDTGGPQEKTKRQIRAEKAAKEAAKSQSKESVATGSKPTTSSVEEPASAPPPERKRERGNASIAAKMLQRDLGLAPPVRGRRGAKRDQPTEGVEPPEEATQPTKDGKVVVQKAPIEKSIPEPSKSAKRDNRPSRSERRAHKATLAETNIADRKSAAGKGADAKTTPQVPAPTILKKPVSSTSNAQPQSSTPAPTPNTNSSQVQPSAPKGPAASRPSTQPSASKIAATAATAPLSPSTEPIRQAFLKHANASQGITESLIEAALSAFGTVEKVEIDRRKGFAYVDFADAEGLQKAIRASPVKVAQGAVQVLEKRERVGGKLVPPPAGGSGSAATAGIKSGGGLGGGSGGGGFRGGRGVRGKGGRGGGGGGANAGAAAGAATSGSPAPPAPAQVQDTGS